MRFSIYSEVQSWPGKSYDRLYGEVLEQIENADRLGYEAYAVVEHLFFPKFSASANVFGLFGMAAARTRRLSARRGEQRERARDPWCRLIRPEPEPGG